MLVLMPCGFHLPETVTEWAADDQADLVPRIDRRAPRGRSSRSTARPTSAGPVRGSSTASSCWPRSWTRRVRRRRADRSWTPIQRVGGAPVMPFRATFACLWCGTAHTTRGPDDLEGWAQLCPDCVGKAGDNGFLRFRLHQAIAERGAAARGDATARSGRRGGGGPRPRSRPRDGRLLRGACARVRRLVPAPRPVLARADPRRRLGCRTGRRRTLARRAAASTARSSNWPPGPGGGRHCSPSKGEASLYDANDAPLARARDRLLAHGLRAHLHVRDAWAEPDRAVDALFTGFWLSHVTAERLPAFLALVHRWLKPGGLFAFIDSLDDPESGTVDRTATVDGVSDPPPRRRPRVPGREGLPRAAGARRTPSRRPASSRRRGGDDGPVLRARGRPGRL